MNVDDLIVHCVNLNSSLVTLCSSVRSWLLVVPGVETYQCVEESAFVYFSLLDPINEPSNVFGLLLTSHSRYVECRLSQRWDSDPGVLSRWLHLSVICSQHDGMRNNSGASPSTDVQKWTLQLVLPTLRSNLTSRIVTHRDIGIFSSHPR